MVRSRLAALLRATVRMQRLAALTGIAELVAARPAAGGGWELAVVRHGRLAGAGVSPPGVHPRPTLTRRPGHRRDGAARARPGPGGHRRGDRADPVLAGATGDPAGGDVLRLGVPGRRRGPVP